ncbi:MAG: hypothetical protein HKO63_09180 [Acidimicrobiia bacterium]|nr:hypothetical protein [Acidimicrobiia bacterium]NNF88624.1 hypothetical protein [Acidimicrobiia bacterium]NNJ47952.1 hypothetical protein [Acidimicrobiia bacterium]NNL12374.1 hypothetical protein [Acidimicrobiia bacterium]NNL98361.1 hypothetical protein [Acidimicrobiia bacterium]
MRRIWPTIALAALLTACGGGELTLSEYASQAEDLVAEMESQFESLDAAWESQVPSAEGARTYWDGRLDIRAEFLDGVRELDPPAAVEDQHAAALDVFARITAADEALAERADAFETITDHWQWVDTPEGRASDALLQEVFAFCRASQADFDATKDLEGLKDLPWIPSEMTEVVSVAFGCPEG